jgi:hypothetical protein
MPPFCPDCGAKFESPVEVLTHRRDSHGADVPDEAIAMFGQLGPPPDARVDRDNQEPPTQQGDSP